MHECLISVKQFISTASNTYDNVWNRREMTLLRLLSFLHELMRLCVYIDLMLHPLLGRGKHHWEHMRK
jgi:hypothetical protein